MVDHHAGGYGSRIAAPKGNDAKRAAVITAVLNLYISPCPCGKAINQMTRGFGHRHDIIDFDFFGIPYQIPGHSRPCRRLHFFIIADHGVYFGHLCKAVWINLRRASGHDHF